MRINTDMTYCNSKDCIHRRGCKRWLGNYDQKDVEKQPRLWMLSDKECMQNDYYDLIRFRNSDGSEI